MNSLCKMTIVLSLAMLASVLLPQHLRAQEEDNFWDRDIEQQKNEAIIDYGEKFENTHFRVFFRRPDTTLQYAKFIADTLLKARLKLTGSMAYQEPEWLKGRKLDVYLKLLEPFRYLGVAAPPILSKPGVITADGWIEISLESYFRKNHPGGALWHGIRATTVHEYYHIVQFGYDRGERPWLMEATAAWFEDKVFPVPEKFWTVNGHRQRIKNWWYNKPFISSFGSHEYASSLFFQYLTERRPGGNYRIRNIWEEAAKIPGNSTYQAISRVLGDNEPWGAKTRALVGDFAVAAFIRDPKRNRTYSFRKLKGLPTAPITEKLQMRGNTLGALRGSTLWPLNRVIKPFQIGYYEIVPSESVVLKDNALENDDNLGRLVVEINAQKRNNWEFRLIEFPRAAADPAKWRVRKFSKTSSRQGWNRLVVEDYPRSRVVLVAINFLRSLKDEEICARDDMHMFRGKKYKKCQRSDITPDAEFKIAATFFNAPVVKSFTVEYPDSTGQYRKVWKTTREKSRNVHGSMIWRTRTTLTEGIRYRWYDDGPRINFFLETSTPVATPLYLFVAGKPVYMLPDGGTRFWTHISAYQNKFSGTMFVWKLDKEIEELEQGDKQVVFLPVEITARDWWDTGFDVKTATAPKLTIAGKDHLRIDNWEDGSITLGGDDVLDHRKIPFHIRNPAPYLAKILVRQKTTRIYKAEWTPDKDVKKEGMRQLVRDKSRPFNPGQSLRIELTFDSPVKDVVVALGPPHKRLSANSLRIEAPNPPNGIKSEYLVVVPPSEKLKKILASKNRVTIFVSAVSQDGIRLDGDPRSPAWYDYDEKRWYWLEEDKEITGSGAGGPDRWHTLHAQGSSFMFLLDASSSMKGQMPSTKQGMINAIRTLRPGDEAALVVFGGCSNYRLVVPFTDNPEEIIKAIRKVRVGGGTPLAEAVLLAKAYMTRAAQFPNPKLMVFSDDAKSNCGLDAGSVFARFAAPDPPDEVKSDEDEPEKIKWFAYKIETIHSRYFPGYRVIEIEYYQEKGKQNLAQLTMRRYPVSTMSSRGRTLWSINWSNRKVMERKKATGKDVDRLRARAEMLRNNTVSRDKIRQAVQEAIGPGAVALKR